MSDVGGGDVSNDRPAESKMLMHLEEVTDLLRSLRGGGKPPDGVDECHACGKPLGVELTGPLISSLKLEYDMLLQRLELERSTEKATLGKQLKQAKREIARLQRDLARAEGMVQDYERILREDG